MSGFARALHVILLGVWLGASLLFLAFAAKVPTMIDSAHLAGDAITTALQIIDRYGVIAGPIIVITLFAGWFRLNVPLRSRAVGSLVMVAAVTLSRYWSTPTIVEAKAEMPMRLEHMDPASPLLQQYQSFHTISSALLLIHTAACLLVLIAAVRSDRQRRTFANIAL